MRLIACLTVRVIPVVANAAQTKGQPPSDAQAYCVNHRADFTRMLGNVAKAAINCIPVTLERLMAIGRRPRMATDVKKTREASEADTRNATALTQQEQTQQGLLAIRTANRLVPSAWAASPRLVDTSAPSVTEIGFMSCAYISVRRCQAVSSWPEGAVESLATSLIKAPVQ